MRALGFFVAGVTLAVAPALAFQSDAEVKQRLIRESLAAYPGPCPCPYSVMRNGRACGARSSYSRPGGYAPLASRPTYRGMRSQLGARQIDDRAAPVILLALQIVAAGTTFTCTPTHVWDGDGPVWCREGPRIRLSGIAAREADGTCRPNQPCPRASAEAARDTLVALIGRPTGRSRQGHILVTGPPLTCASEGDGVGSRTAAWCRTAGGVDLSCGCCQSNAN